MKKLLENMLVLLIMSLIGTVLSLCSEKPSYIPVETVYYKHNHPVLSIIIGTGKVLVHGLIALPLGLAEIIPSIDRAYEGHKFEKDGTAYRAAYIDTLKPSQLSQEDRYFIMSDSYKKFKRWQDEAIRSKQTWNNGNYKFWLSLYLICGNCAQK